MKVTFWLDAKQYDLSVREEKKNDIKVMLGKNTYHVSVDFLCSDEMLINIDGKIYDVFVNANTNSYSVGLNGRSYHIEKKSAAQILGPNKSELKRAEVKTSMPGKIVKVLAQTMDAVEEGQPILILEAMKMQNEIKSPRTGKITRINPSQGDSVETGALLFVVE